MQDEKPPVEDDTPPRRSGWRWVVRLLFLLVVVGGSLFVMRHPDTSLPAEWNVFEPLRVADPVTPVTRWKLDWALDDPAVCTEVLEAAASAREMAPLAGGANCGIDHRVDLRGVGDARLDAVETSCAVALRLAMWERHGVQPLAREILGAEVSVIRHVGSYNCRPIRGETRRMSTHATAEAIDITGFDLTDGRRIRLLGDWGGGDAEATFLRRVRDASCTWFKTTLGPDYNALHADHFHLQSRGWGTCR